MSKDNIQGLYSVMCIDLFKIFCDLVSGLPGAESTEPA